MKNTLELFYDKSYCSKKYVFNFLCIVFRMYIIKMHCIFYILE